MPKKIFKSPYGDFELEEIIYKMRPLLKNKTDITGKTHQIKKMIEYMLPRKEEKLVQKINKSNIATYLVSFIPSESIEVLREKVKLEDPVRVLI